MSVYDKVDEARAANGQPSVAEEAEVARAAQIKSRPSLIRLSLLQAYEKQIAFLEKVALGEPFELSTHTTITTGGGKTTRGTKSRRVSSRSSKVEIYTPTLDERMRAVEHLAKFGLGAPNVNLDKDGDNAKSVVITERAE